MLMSLAEEFNKYLSYVRNLGFEDTPDYDFLRDLFTQALKNTGEVEDGEYDWNKLNGGRGWEAAKSHPSAHHLAHQANVPPEASARALRDAPGARGSDGRPIRADVRGAISADRLNAAQPPPPGSPAKPGVAAMGKSARDRTSAAGGGALPKRSSGLAEQLDVAMPVSSTQAQFQNSNANLTANQTRQSAATGALQSHQGRPQQQPEPQPTFMQKIMNALCCGSGKLRWSD
jgi:casein kinase 1